MLDQRLFPPDYRGKYPHMFPGDVEIWELFLNKYSSLYNGFYYDVMCGDEVYQFPRWEMPYKKDAQVLSRLRIDAVGERDNVIDIIEVKPRGNMASVGQLLTYKEQYIKDYKPTKIIRAVLVCGDLDTNIIPILQKSGIVHMVV